jgi:hypothetical protein
MGLNEKPSSAAEYKKAVEKLEESIKTVPENPDNGFTYRLWLSFSLYSLMLDEEKEKNLPAARRYYQRAREVAEEAAKRPPNVPGDEKVLDVLRKRIEQDQPKE